MSRFIEGEDRQQVLLMPECLDDYVAEDNPVRIVDAFVGELDLADLGFEGATAAATGRPAYHPGVLLKIYIYGYLNRIQSSRRLERECQRIGADSTIANILLCVPDFFDHKRLTIENQSVRILTMSPEALQKRTVLSVASVEAKS